MPATVALRLFFIVASLIVIIVRRVLVLLDPDLRLVAFFRWRLVRVLLLRERSRRNNAAHHGCQDYSLQPFHNYVWPPHVSFVDERAWEGERRDAPPQSPAIWMP